MGSPTISLTTRAEITSQAEAHNAAPKWSAIITLWKREDYLSEQLHAIRSQSIPPEEIIIILNEGHISELKIRKIGGPDIKIIRSDINSLYTRWAIAYIAKGEYVSVFDDDIVPGKFWIANAIRACSSYNALVGPAGRIYSKHGIHDYYNLVLPNAEGAQGVSCDETDVYCDWVCNSYMFKREWVGHALSSLRHKDSFKTFDDIQLATSLYLSAGIRCVTPMQPSFDKDFHGSLRPHYGNDSHAIWKTNSDQHFTGRKAYIEELIAGGYVPVQQRDNLHQFHLIVPFGERNTLERCLLTIKGQDYQNFTCTLIDDCCDGKDALDLIKRIGLDKINLRYIKTNKKAYPLRAREIASDMVAANLADVVVHLDGDDWLPYPDVLSRLNRIYRQGGIHVTYGNALCIRNLSSHNFSEFTQYDMSRKWNVAQRNLNAPVLPFRRITREEISNDWNNAPWCGFHLRTFKYSKWLGLNRKSFYDRGGNYLKVATDAAVLIPILNSCKYDSVEFVPDLAYIYQNAANTIHGKGEITPSQKSEALACIANSDSHPNYEQIKNALMNERPYVSADEVDVLHDGHIKSKRGIFNKSKNINSTKESKISCATTIVTPNYIADAILSLLTYQHNSNGKCDLYVLVATKNPDEIEASKDLLSRVGIKPLFPMNLTYTQDLSDALARKYKFDTDEYRWGMKSVILIELLNDGNDLAVFLDPDTYAVSDISDIHEAAACHPISLFPHFRDPDHDRTREILYKDGFFNGGMIGATQSGIPALKKLYNRCLNEIVKDPGRHKWDDQKYLDLVLQEANSVFINLDHGVDYNYWNFSAPEGLIAPSQRSMLLQSGFFVRHWHITTTLIRESIDLENKKFSVYRPIIAIYLMSLMYTILLILILERSNKSSCGENSLGLEARFKSLFDKLTQVSNAMPVSMTMSLFDKVTQPKNFDRDQMLKICVDSISQSICFDNHEFFASLLLNIFPDSQISSNLADDLRSKDLRYISDKILGSTNLNQEDKTKKIEKLNAGDLLKQRLRALQLCNLTY